MRCPHRQGAWGPKGSGLPEEDSKKQDTVSGQTPFLCARKLPQQFRSLQWQQLPPGTHRQQADGRAVALQLASLGMLAGSGGPLLSRWDGQGRWAVLGRVVACSWSLGPTGHWVGDHSKTALLSRLLGAPTWVLPGSLWSHTDSILKPVQGPGRVGGCQVSPPHE